MPVYGKVFKLDKKSIENVEENGFMPVNEYAALWRPKTEETGEEAYGVIYIKSERITMHLIQKTPLSEPEVCDKIGCRLPIGWTSFYVNSPQEFSTIVDILRNGYDVSFRPTDYAIKTNWKMIKRIEKQSVIITDH